MRIFKGNAKTTQNVISELRNPFTLPENEADFKEHHVKVLRRLDKHPEKESFTGMITKEVDIPKFIPILLRLGLIHFASYKEALSMTKLTVLKTIAKNNSLPITGNKQTLVDRIYNGADENKVKKDTAYSEYYILTPKGRSVIEKSYSIFDEKRQSFFKENMELILNQNFNTAFQNICKRNAELPIPPGINCDWEKWYYEGLSMDRAKISKSFFKKSSNKLIAATALYCFYSSDTYRNASNLLSKVYDINFDTECIYTKLSYEASILSVEYNILVYQHSGIKKFRFISTLDDLTCPVCGVLDGQVFSINQKKIGVNCPPMHDGCRCTTIPVIDGRYPSRRRARNPVTHKSEVVPYINYSDWIKQFH